MSDVAAAAGVSTTTVSRVLRGEPRGIPERTQQHVIDVSRSLGYRTNALARGLRTRSSDTIGFISDVIASTSFAGAMVHGANKAAAEAGKLLLVVDTEDDPNLERKAIDSLHERQVDAVIYATMFHRVVDPPAALREGPCVILDSTTPRPSDSWVVPDEEGGAYGATNLLIEAGHRRIGYLMDSRDVPAPAERFSGYRRALSDAGLDFDAQLVAMAPSDPFGGHDAAERLLRLPEPPTALFCFNDRMAMGAYRAIRRAGLSIPDDISVVGFDDLDQIAPWLDPPLTTMRLPHEEMGRWAVEYLLSVLRGDDVGTRQERLTCPPVIRDSVAPPRQGQPST